MAFDSETRRRLAGFVTAARGLLQSEFAELLPSTFGIRLDGTSDPVESLIGLDEPGLQLAETLRERITYLAVNLSTEKTDIAKTKWAVDQLAREQAFTVLNRLAAIRMAEKRGIVQESVAKGFQSKAFRVFENLAGNSLGETFPKYRQFLNCLFDELAVDLGLLFDRNAPQGLLFPRETALLKLLELFNDRDLDNLWAEDETIGWIYQYYNDPAERKEMRDKSAAPRNSRELAVRNQFFTPRYVVEFLTDNTLGRIWYEMCQGKTNLKDRCRYLVRRPNEIFLKEGEATPEQHHQENLSQEELLKQPVYIPHRQLKDPRTILMLDPACGSMHFGLYAFDLFEEIYHEAWDREEQNPCALLRSTGMKSLHQSYADKTLFLSDIPRLIIEHNIHGVDIDPRATQIAALSLWLRAHRTWNDQKTPLAQRPRITKSNIVCAEPMPGAPALLQEFVKASFPENEHSLFQRLLEQIFEKMQLAGEAGSLLKIEEEITSAVEEAKVAWAKSHSVSKELFGTSELNAAKKPGSQADLLGLDTALIALDVQADFWESIEERIYAALRDYAEQAETEAGFQRRLFAEDAARGFAFIDVCRKRYDVVLMNPPFGDPCSQSKALISKKYPSGKPDIYACFVILGNNFLETGGRLGVLSSRTGFFLPSLEKWRKEHLLGFVKLDLVADLGLGILDAAMVEASAYVISRSDVRHCQFFSCLASSQKDEFLLNQINLKITENVFIRKHSLFENLPQNVIAYWVSESIISIFRTNPPIEGNAAKVRIGLQTSDDFRFLRLYWEVPESNIGRRKKWVPFAKGGEYQLFYDDIHLVVCWANNAAEMKAFAMQHAERTGSMAGNGPLREFDFYFKGGLTYPERTTSDFGPRLLPDNCITGTVGPGIHIEEKNNRALMLGWMTTRLVREVLEIGLGMGDAVESGSAARHYNVRLIGRTPFVNLDPPKADIVISNVVFIVQKMASSFSLNETARNFLGKFRCLAHGIKKNAEFEQFETWQRIIDIISHHKDVEDVFINSFGQSDQIRIALDNNIGRHPATFPDIFIERSEVIDKAFSLSIENLVDLCSDKLGHSRQVSKKSFFADRKIELISQLNGTSPKSIVDYLKRQNMIDSCEARNFAAKVISWIIGVIFGRWDIRNEINEKAEPNLPDPFSSMPTCPPAQLQNTQGLPALFEDLVAEYPVRIEWEGILVDEPNHLLDIERRIREVLEIIWNGKDGGPTAEFIELEACDILGVKSLRDYFRKPTGFFATHLQRYSKSRRQAPIYWPLSSSRGNYTLWLYYHRLSDQTLHTALLEFVEPKLKAIEIEISHIRETNGARDRLSELLDFQDELKEFELEIKRIIHLPWKPNLNDGVLITASPLWKLFRFPAWQRNLKATWQELERGDFDWAHLAYSIWPDRVKEKCKSDRSMAIAHGLEHLCTVEAPRPKRGRKTKSVENEVNDLYPTEDEGKESSKESPRQKNADRQPKTNLAESDLPIPKRRGRPPKNPSGGN